MKCKNCGHEIQQGDLFCENCGAKVEPELTRSGKNAQNKQLDIAHPIDAQTRQYIEQEILQEYKRACEQSEDQPQEESSDLIVPEAAAEPAEASLA